MKDSVDREALVMPNNTSLNCAGALFSFSSSLFFSTAKARSTCSFRVKPESPGSVISTFRNICRTMTSMCLSFILTPCNRYTSWISFTM